MSGETDGPVERRRKTARRYYNMGEMSGVPPVVAGQNSVRFGRLAVKHVGKEGDVEHRSRDVRDKPRLSKGVRLSHKTLKYEITTNILDKSIKYNAYMSEVKCDEIPTIGVSVTLKGILNTEGENKPRK